MRVVTELAAHRVTQRGREVVPVRSRDRRDVAIRPRDIWLYLHHRAHRQDLWIAGTARDVNHLQIDADEVGRRALAAPTTHYACQPPRWFPCPKQRCGHSVPLLTSGER